jgi:hypothetical protein
MKRFWCPVVVLLLVTSAGCTEETPHPALSGTQASHARAAQSLVFVHRAPHTPPFKDEAVSLTARAGEASEAALSFADGSPFARFRLSAESMRGATLSGQRIPEGTAITITLKRVDASRYLIDFQPSGLEFNPAAPAEVEFFYANALLPPGEVTVFKQERVGDAWVPTRTSDDRPGRVMRASVEDFTIYAMAGGRQDSQDEQ